MNVFRQAVYPAQAKQWLIMGSIVAAAVYAGTLEQFGYDGRALATVGAVALAALLSGVAGFAFSAICGAMVFQFRHDTVDVVQIMLVCSIANQSMSVWALRRDIRARALAPFVAGGLAGVASGVWLLLHVTGHAYAAALGTVLLAYGGYMLFRKPIVLVHSPLAGDVAAGFIGGLMGGFAATPGAAASIWCGMKGWDKLRQRAVFQPFILICQMVALTLIWVAREGGGGHFGIPSLALVCIPAGLAGTYWGLACFSALSDRNFRIAINLLLIVSGAGLVL